MPTKKSGKSSQNTKTFYITNPLVKMNNYIMNRLYDNSSKGMMAKYLVLVLCITGAFAWKNFSLRAIVYLTASLHIIVRTSKILIVCDRLIDIVNNLRQNTFIYDKLYYTLVSSKLLNMELELFN